LLIIFKSHIEKRLLDPGLKLINFACVCASFFSIFKQVRAESTPLASSNWSSKSLACIYFMLLPAPKPSLPAVIGKHMAIHYVLHTVPFTEAQYFNI
jgi:hypothetical protein